MKDLLPAGWSSTTLKEITEKIGSGATPKGGESSYKPEGTPLIRSKNIIFFGFKNERLAFLDKEQARALDNATVRAHDVLLNITGASIGRVTIAPSWADNARVNQHVCIIRMHTLIRPEYISAYLSSPIIQGMIEEENYGVTRQALTKKQVEEIEVPIPPLNEQCRIIDKLDTTLAAIEVCKQQLNNAAETIQRFRQAVLASAVSGGLTKNWRAERGASNHTKTKLGEIIRVSSGEFLSPKQTTKNGNIPVYGANGIKCYHDQANTDGEQIIIGRVGSCGSIHTTKGPAWVTDNALIVSFDKTLFNQKYLSYLLQASNLSKLSSSTTQPSISGRKIYEEKVYIASSYEEQCVIAEKVEAAERIVNKVRESIEQTHSKITLLTSSLLAKSFRGELVPQDPNDEPASVLLERIKTQRKAEAAAKKPAKRGRKKKADAAELVIPKGIADNHLAKLLEECGSLSERALLAASELEPAVFQLQITKELKAGGLKQVAVDGEAAYADAAWEEEK